MRYLVHFNKKHNEMNDEKLYLCSICRKPFKSIKGVRGLKTHIRIDHFQHRPHQCPHCEMSFDLEAHLSRHLESRHPSLWKGGEKNYLCDKCDSQFFTRNLLYSHKQKDHQTGTFVCSKCGKSFGHQRSLKKHLTNVHVEPGCFVCDICGKIFITEKSLKSHEERHKITEIPGVQYTCTVEGCNRVFGLKRSRDDHAKNPYVHGKTKPKNHICKFCSKEFSEKISLVIHEKSVHLNVKDFKCEKCDFASACKNKLKLHITSIHDGVMYSCDYVGCTKSYNLKGNLDAHRFRVHKIARPKKAQILSNN